MVVQTEVDKRCVGDKSMVWIVVVVVLWMFSVFFFFFNDTATTEIYTLSLHDALPISLKNQHGKKIFSKK